MISALDTNILLDVFLPDPVFGECSRRLIAQQAKSGELVICDIVYAELAGMFHSQVLLDNTLATLQIRYEPLSQRAAYAAGAAWKRYRVMGGSRTRMIADFLIGAHAHSHADLLCTRDRGFYRRYFSRLKIVEPK